MNDPLPATGNALEALAALAKDKFGEIDKQLGLKDKIEEGARVVVSDIDDGAAVAEEIRSAGGEAIANTQWSVLTPGGDSIKESIGAFPSVILAEGDYIAVARHDGKTYQQTFRVHSGRDSEIEVLAH